MKEVYQEAEQFLNDLFAAARFDLHAEANEGEAGCTLNIDGEDAHALRSEGGELLDAFEHFVNQAFSRELPENTHFICDVHSFRAIRESELRAMAIGSVGGPATSHASMAWIASRQPGRQGQ